jgi:hypothetical protein
MRLSRAFRKNAAAAAKTIAMKVPSAMYSFGRGREGCDGVVARLDTDTSLP